MVRALINRILPGLLLVALPGCGENRPVVGQVAVKVAPGFKTPQLALDTDKWFSSDADVFMLKESGNPTVLRRAPGAYKLLFERDGKRQPACNFAIKKDRVITITVRVVGRDVKCDIVE